MPTLTKTLAVAGPCPVPPPALDDMNPTTAQEWVDGVREHFKDKGLWLTVQGLANLAWRESKTYEQGYQLASTVKHVLDEELRPREYGNVPEEPEQPETPAPSPVRPQPGPGRAEGGNAKERPAPGARTKLYGYPTTAVLRALGAAGWDAATAGKAVRAKGAEVSDITVKIQVKAGRDGDASRGDPAALTADQIAELRAM